MTIVELNCCSIVELEKKTEAVGAQRAEHSILSSVAHRSVAVTVYCNLERDRGVKKRERELVA